MLVRSGNTIRIDGDDFERFDNLSDFKRREVIDWNEKDPDWVEPEWGQMPVGSMHRLLRPPSDGKIYRLPHQVPNPNYRHRIYIKGRRQGGTHAMMLEVIDHLWEYKEKACVVIAAQTWRQTHDLLAVPLRDMFRDEFIAMSLAGVSPYMKHIAGGMIYLRSGDNPDQWRGGGYTMMALDEIAQWTEDNFRTARDSVSSEILTRMIMSTTPLAQRKYILSLIDNPYIEVVKADIYDNPFMPPEWVREQIETYGLTSDRERQELMGEIIRVVGNIFRSDWVEENRVSNLEGVEISRIAVGIDPAVEGITGIVCVGKSLDNHYYVLESVAMENVDPGKRNIKAIDILHKWEEKLEVEGVIVIETNIDASAKNSIIQYDPKVKVIEKRAQTSKMDRADEVSSLYERGMVHHVGFNEGMDLLEKDMYEFPGTRKGKAHADLMDALIWAMKVLIVIKRRVLGVSLDPFTLKSIEE